jgi:hypothetical protein
MWERFWCWWASAIGEPEAAAPCDVARTAAEAIRVHLARFGRPQGLRERNAVQLVIAYDLADRLALDPLDVMGHVAMEFAKQVPHGT